VGAGSVGAAIADEQAPVQIPAHSKSNDNDLNMGFNLNRGFDNFGEPARQTKLPSALVKRCYF
jgi:hypothetical protein